MKRRYLHQVKKPSKVDAAEFYDAGHDYEAGYAKPLKRLLPHILRKELVWSVDYEDGDIDKVGEPILFMVASAGVKTLNFLKRNKVDFYQKDSYGKTLLHKFSHFDEYDEMVFMWTLNWFKAHGYVDAIDNDGFTALSGAIKFGSINKARQLLEAGADAMSRAKSAYQNGTGLTPWTQAIICLDGEDKGIACLELLMSKSKPTTELITEMIELAKSLSHLKTVKWIKKIAAE
jgi:hypothetical protein